MKLIFCIDDKNGMMFFGKRQSQDRVLRAWLMEYTKTSRLLMNSYSAKQFADCEGFVVDDAYMDSARDADYCFVENGDYDMSLANEVLICKWNRRYQADRVLTEKPEEYDLSLKKTHEFAGSSHEKITVLVYRKD